MIKTFVRFCDFLFRCLSDYLKRFSAEREGFEPRVPCSTTVFKTAAIDHSATSPKLKKKHFSLKAMQRYKSFFNLQIYTLFFHE